MSEAENNNVEKPIDKKAERRLVRQKIRRRNRIIAFAVLFLVLAVIGVGAFFGIKVVMGLDRNTATQEEILPTPTPTEVVEETEIVDMTPESVEETEEVVEESEVTEEVNEQSDEELLEEMVRSMIEEMTLEEKVAGLFILSPEILTGQGNVTKAGDGTKNALEQYPIGGIVYSKQNIKSEDQLKTMIDSTISFNRYPMFIAVSEAGGSDGNMSSLKVESTMTEKEVAAEGNSSTSFDNFNTIGNYLVANGFNLDFAPVADVMSNGTSDSFGEDASNVSTMVASAIGGLKEAGVFSCVKSFPGKGYVDGNPNQELASTARTKEQMLESELLPFQTAIEAGTDMIMVGHFSAPELTEDNMPCSLSKAVMTELLRNEMGYDGIIITEAMNVSSITQYYAADEVAVKALKAGADMILMPENFQTAFDAVVAAVQDGTIDERRIDDSLCRVYKVKYRDTLEN